MSLVVMRGGVRIRTEEMERSFESAMERVDRIAAEVEMDRALEEVRS